MTTQTAFDLDALRRTVAAGDVDAFGELLADDVEWSEIDQRTPPAAPSVVRGRDAVLEVLREGVARGIATEVADAFVSSDRGALRFVCTYPAGGGQVVSNALLHIRDGRIARYDGVQAWDE